MKHIDQARLWHEHGGTPLPIRADGTKAPAVATWKQWQDAQPDWDTLAPQLSCDSDGIGVLTGAASGGLEMLELEGRAVTEGVLTELTEHIANHDLAEVWQRITSGYTEVTPSGGLHFLYRISDAPVAGNQRLACRPPTDDELVESPKLTRQVLIETRGQDGFVVVAPSNGRTHRTGKPWMLIRGGIATIATITSDERDAIVAMAQMCDQMPDPTPVHAEPHTSTRIEGELRPGDDYNERADWNDILPKHGWTAAKRLPGGAIGWTRPGKNPRDGISATTGIKGRGVLDRLYVFTSSTEFEPERPYSKFAALALLEHNGDLSACASRLRGEGYGTPYTPPTLSLLPGGLTATPGKEQRSTTRTDGALALDIEPEPTLEGIRLEHDALALSLVSQFGERLRYCPQRGMWLSWDGSRWQWDEAREHREVIRDLARSIPEIDKTTTSFRRGVLTANGIKSVAELASSDRRISVHIDNLDAHPWHLNTPAGIINLRTGELSQPSSEALHTRTTTVAPDFDMPAPVWGRFLEDTFGGDKSIVEYVQRLLGAFMVGEVLEQILPFWHGTGANGKSTLVEVVMAILGRGRDGYSTAVPSEMLMMRRNPEHPTELAQLAGVRLAVASELEDGAKFAEARVKQLTGRDSINARFMRADPFTFTPSASIILIGNHKPSASVGGPAFWRRLQQLDFKHVVPEADRDPDLPRKLEAEHPAILAWLARGAAEYARTGLRPPESVKASTRAYEAAEDTVGRFVEDMCTIASSPGSAAQMLVRVSKVRECYERFCSETGDPPVSARRLTQELRDRFGVESEKGTAGSRFYRGLSVDLGSDDADD